MDNLLRVRELCVDYPVSCGWVSAVDRVSFALGRQESLGIIGESGCGKTSLMKALLRLTPPRTRVSGSVLLGDLDLLKASYSELQKVRWRRLALIPQSSMNSLDPVYRVGDQIAEAITAHESIGQRAAWARAGQLLDMVGVPAERRESFPHQLSGGTRQRVCIAMALALAPALLIADEPTTALDVVTQHRILAELRRLKQDRGISLVLVSHDIALVSGTCDRVLVMYGGIMAELGPVGEVLRHPAHPYSAGLIQSYPQLTGARELLTISGRPPDLRMRPPGCIFAPRCPLATPECQREIPPLVELAPGHQAACHHAGDPAMLRREVWMVAPSGSAAAGDREQPIAMNANAGEASA